MIEMIDRVALAINAAWNKSGDVPFPLYQREAEAIARAAIEAMREPTDAMIMSADESACLDDNWRSMIDEALK